MRRRKKREKKKAMMKREMYKGNMDVLVHELALERAKKGGRSRRVGDSPGTHKATLPFFG